VTQLDVLFNALTVESSWAGIVMGFVLVLGIIFVTARVFSKGNNQLSTFGFMVVGFIGMILATVLGLFPAYILIIFIVIGLILILLKTQLGGNNGE